MKRICIFSLAYYPHVGGAEVAIKEITDRISPEDIEFHMITLRFSREDAREEKVGNVLVHRVGFGSSYLAKILFVPHAAFVAYRLHLERPFDGLWAMMTYMLFPVQAGKAFGFKLPYALTLQDGDPWQHVFRRWYIRLFLPSLRRGFREATVVSAISTYLSQWAKRMGYKREVALIPNGVDIAHFSREFEPVERQAFLQTVGKKEGDIFLVTTSRLVKKNAVDVVIRALPLLPANVRFLVLGIGQEEAALKKLAQEQGVAERVEFLGHVGHEDLPKYLQISDIFVRPSRSEGMGSSFVEAMAAGLPVIATQEGGIKDFLFDSMRDPDHAPTGFAVDSDSPAQVADAVTRIFANPDETRAVVEQARELVREKYDWDQIVQDMQESVFGKLLSEG